MQVHISTPYRRDKNLGLAYNETMALIPDDDWSCFTDTDALFLTPDVGHILHEYASRNPDAALLTCFVNRASTLSTAQLLTGTVDERSDIKVHIPLAENQKKFLYQTTPINQDISGTLMLISKKSWKKFPFREDLKCLGVDTYYNRTLREHGQNVLRMDGLYIFHIYRIMNGIHDKRHLK